MSRSNGAGLVILLVALLLLEISPALGQEPLPLELPSIDELAGFTGGVRFPDLRLSRIAGGIAEGVPPTLPIPSGLKEDEASKLGPFLRIILQGDREARQRGEALNLAGFAPLVQVYARGEPLLSRPVPTGMGQFLPAKPGPLQAAWAGKIGVLVKARSPSALALGLGEAMATAGEITIARVSLTQLRRLAQSPEVIYIEAAYLLQPELDRSIPAIGADLLHQEEPTVKGEGVIIGDVDTGVDYEHLDFRLDRDGDGFEESSRLFFIWDQTEPGPFGSRITVPMGTEYSRAEIEADLTQGLGPAEGMVREQDESGHGTHVLGIAAGDGSSSGAGYEGVAPAAELIMVKTSFYSGDVVAGVDYIFRKAEELERPCVVNLSLGGHFGPHDGTSNFDQALEGLLGPGRVIVNSAGNEGDKRVHIGGQLASQGRSSAQFAFIPDGETVFLNVWYPGQADFQIDLEAPVEDGLAQVITAAGGQAVLKETKAGKVSIDNASGGPNPNNGDKQIGVLLEDITAGEPWTVRLRARSGRGRFDVWPGLASMGYFLEGDSEMTISEPGNAQGIITTGAYTTRVEWRSRDGNQYHFRGASFVGQIAPFSSRGPTRDGRQKPDLSAPGTAIASALAAGSELSEIPELIVPDGDHVILQGTSAAAPHLAGTAALMLQVYPRLGPAEAAEKLRQTAVHDGQVGEVPGEVWGFGKLNAERGVNLIGLELPGAGGPPEVKAGTNPASEQVLFTYAVPLGAEEVQLMVFNVVGEPVFAAELDPLGDRFTWSLVNNEGEPLANGLYIYIVIADGNRSMIHRLVIRR